MRSRAPRPKQETIARVAPPPVFYRLHALLHTIQVIEQFEDQLCGLMHEIQTTGTVTPGVSVELEALLADIPSHQYQDELNALHQALAPATPPQKPIRKRTTVSNVSTPSPKGKGVSGEATASSARAKARVSASLGRTAAAKRSRSPQATNQTRVTGEIATQSATAPRKRSTKTNTRTVAPAKRSGSKRK